ncbi:Ternary complex factor MIP1 [Musa troglodytarum]|uniref:Ternary complex factor MIP1 n=1 Tax=Musa troglodytarum TaxID=320322 RepID=A0A9E7EE35_9LILI|nr:Ternary complex factor MIP1 [Musa troglodytarum]
MTVTHTWVHPHHHRNTTSGTLKIVPVEAMGSVGEVSARHRRSKSDSDKRTRTDKLDASVKSFHHVRMHAEEAGQAEIKKGPSPIREVESSLKKEIQQLEKCLEDQFVVRQALEKALRHKSSAIDTSIDGYIPKPTKELIREIAMLELEVVHLEQYLLSLYRRAFEQRISNVSPTAVEDVKKQQLIPFRKAESAFQSSHILLPRKSANKLCNEACPVNCREKHGRGIHRSHSSLVPRSHGQDFNSGVISLADHLGTTIADHITETPNKLSEDMIKSMCAIYCKLSDDHDRHHRVASSPTLSFSSRNTFSPCYMKELQSPYCKREAVLDAWLENSCCTERLKDFSGPYTVMVEVSSICKHGQRSSDLDEMLQNYKLLVQRLEMVDPRSMSNDEKIAFWINIHNAIMMHAHLEYGIPGSNIKKASLLIKNTYNIGGRMINADIIQGSILGCRMHPPGQWLRLLLFSQAKIKDGDEWKTYAIKNPEPLVGVYSPKRLFHQLESARMEYIHATVTVRKGCKILLPRLVDFFAKDSNQSTQELLDMIKCYLPERLRLVIDGRHESSCRKIIEWVPHNFSFRYLLPRELGNA